MLPNDFIKAIQTKNKVRLTFFSKEDQQDLVRICAPMDYGPSRKVRDKNNRFHFWDYDSDKSKHTLSLLPDQIKKIEILDETFKPQEFVTWDTQKSTWFIDRDWGDHS